MQILKLFRFFWAILFFRVFIFTVMSNSVFFLKLRLLIPPFFFFFFAAVLSQSVNVDLAVLDFLSVYTRLATKSEILLPLPPHWAPFSLCQTG